MEASISSPPPKPEPTEVVRGATQKAKDIILNPTECWQRLKEEYTTVSELYLRYIILLAGAGAVCELIGHTLIGSIVRMPFFAALMFTLVTFLNMLAIIAITAIAMEKLAPRFGGSANRLLAYRLVGYSLTPAFVGRLALIIPFLAPIGLLFGLYSFYLFWQGLPKMIDIPEEKRALFAVTTLVVMVVSSMVVMTLLSPMIPSIMPTSIYPQ